MKKSLKRLIIDSATKDLFVALYEGESNLCDYFQRGNNDHSVVLMPQIEKMMNDNRWKVKDIDEIIIGIGPGSYTGLRVGVVIAKMFGWNNDIPVRTISSLAMLASSSDIQYVIPEIDARRGNSFLGLYENSQSGLKLVCAEELVNLNEYVDLKRKEYENIEVVSVGKPNIIKILNSDLLETVEDIHSLNPNYLRLTEAERNLNK